MVIDVATAEKCRQLSHAAYGGSLYSLANKLGFVTLSIENKTTKDKYDQHYFKGASGCAAAVYQNKVTNEIIIAYRGTERDGLGDAPMSDLRDIEADIQLMMNSIPPQFQQALTFYNAVMDNLDFTNVPSITLTGHSLGGALATLVSLKGGCHPTYTFNAPGIKHLLNNLGLPSNGNYNAITNYSVMNDWCGMVNAHIGKLYVFPPQLMRKLNSPNDIAGYAPLIDTHEWILSNKVNLNKAFPKPIGFNESEALSLWYYDINNYIDSFGLVGLGVAGRELLKFFTSKISTKSLEHAIEILRSNSKFIEYEFRYETPNKTYVLGLPEKENIIIGSKDNEIIYGGNKIDSMSGGAGNDELHGFEGNDTLRGGTGDDTLYAMSGNDTLYGDAGNDELFADTGNNRLYGGSGNDILHDGPGKNYLSGGSGYDIYVTGRYSGGATIGDSDGYGEINYDGVLLNKATRMSNEEYKWRDGFGNIFVYTGSNLIINNKITVQSFKNGSLNIMLFKEDGITPEPTIPGGNNSSEGEGEGSGGGDGSGSGGIGSGGTGESNFDYDDEGNLIDGENPEEGGGVPPIGGQLGPRPGGGVDKVPPTAGPPNNPPVDPLIFDLDFNNIISLSKPENGRNFDIDNDGIAQKVAWIDSGDAILVCDRNGNGTIDNGLELFGDNTLLEDGTYAKSGIEALAEFDTNKDGKITISDLKFSDLKLLKSDNTTITLEEAGIKEINLSYTAVNKTDKNGNRQVKEAKFITEDGEEHMYGEFMLNQNIYQSVSAEIIPVSEEVAALPDVNGSGLVHSLHQAIMRDVSGGILGALQAFLNEEDIDLKHALCEQLIYKWAGTEDISTTSREDLFDGRKLATIEAFAGTYLQGSKETPVRTQAAADILKEGFNNFVGFVYSTLAIQTHMGELFSSLNY